MYFNSNAFTALLQDLIEYVLKLFNVNLTEVRKLYNKFVCGFLLAVISPL